MDIQEMPNTVANLDKLVIHIQIIFSGLFSSYDAVNVL